MPNHLHGILEISKSVADRHAYPLRPESQYQNLPVVIGSFKSAATKQVNKMLSLKWQKSYYDRIIRNEKELGHIRVYITNNPLKWDLEKQENSNDQRNPSK